MDPVHLMNTCWADRHGRHDALTSATDLVLLVPEVPGRPGSAEVQAWRSLRTALRSLAAEVTGDPRDAGQRWPMREAVALVNETAALVSIAPRLVASRGALARAVVPPTWPAARRAVALNAMDLLVDGNLRACLAPGCVLYFVQDHPRREWCSDACGNRARAARHYARHKG